MGAGADGELGNPTAPLPFRNYVKLQLKLEDNLVVSVSYRCPW